MHVEHCTMNESVGKMHLGWPIVPAQDSFDVLKEKEKGHGLSTWLIHRSQGGSADPAGRGGRIGGVRTPLSSHAP